ncbi:hypothetical protein [Xanthomonas phaseoli]|uniref:hypothetical protein n=1 Tax=Xanthomonas phaseoli TaxID=1985254 RepID=UPI000580B30B|nr:hypothetical protein [Xanthomonas phaseoli]KHS33712.1 hypothetical protein RN19_20810 [Xanthomonas phaseoli pv. phaseoli]
MNLPNDSSLIPVPASKSCELIMRGVAEFKGLKDQRIFLDSLMFQCALLTRMTGGDKEYHAFLDRLRDMSFEELEHITHPRTQQSGVS